MKEVKETAQAELEQITGGSLSLRSFILGYPQLLMHEDSLELAISLSGIHSQQLPCEHGHNRAI